MTKELTKQAQPQAECFTFGEPAPLIESRDLFDYLECARFDKWYEPPICPRGLAKTFRSAVHHESAIYFKVNVLSSCFKPHPLLSRQAFRQMALDYIVMGNCYLEEITNRRNRAKQYKASLAKYTRRSSDLNGFWFVQSYLEPYEFKNRVFHIMEPDIEQEIYGIPQYMSALQSIFLNENATLFRRKYYLNGSHAGFILYVNDTVQDQTDIEAMRKALKEARGPGNFRNLFMYAPNGKKDGVQVIPISEVAAKDEFIGIKDVTRDDMLAAHRVPPALMGIVPKNSGGFGSIEQAAEVFYRNEIQPLTSRFEELNEQAGDGIVQFDEYKITDSSGQ